MPETGIIIRAPATPAEWQNYFDLRWRVLRAPWGQPRGSERDELEETAVHRMVCTSFGKLLAVGRLHCPVPRLAQVRFMAVDPAHRHRGVGKKLLEALEEAATGAKCREVVLHARETSLPFYQKYGYEMIEKSHILYNEIQHFKMCRLLTD